MALNQSEIKEIAATIWQTLINTASFDVIGSWGIEKCRPASGSINYEGRKIIQAGLELLVNGLIYKGKMLIMYNDRFDLYDIYFVENGTPVQKANSIGFESLVETIDRLIEKGDLTDKEYATKVKQVI